MKHSYGSMQQTWEEWQGSAIIHATQTANSNNGELPDYQECFFFAIKEIKNGDKMTFDYNWECDDNQTRMECKCRTVNCKGFIEIRV